MSTVGDGGALLGKQILTYGSAGVEFTHAELVTFTRRYRRTPALEMVGNVYSQIAGRNQSAGLVGNVPVPLHALAYMAMLLLEHGKDERQTPLDARGLAGFAERYIGIRHPELGDHGAATAFRHLLMMHCQVIHQRPIRHLSPRTWMLFGEIWPTLEASRDLDIGPSIHSGFGAPLAAVLGAGMCISALSTRGSFDSSDMREFDHQKGCVHPQEIRAVAKALSATVETLRAEAASSTAPTPENSIYRPNPLVRWPLVRTRSADRYLVPCPRYVLERTTLGVYRSLSDAHRAEGGVNPFRVKFGAVFQEYVGRILQAALPGAVVLPELVYGPKKVRRDSVDWIVVEGRRAVFIEVKQAGLNLEGKTWGQADEVVDNLRRTLGKAVAQLATFRADVDSRVDGLERFCDVVEVEHLVITNDDLSWSNFVLRSHIESLAVELKFDASFPFHVATIDELESLLAHVWHGSLFDALKAKREIDHDFHQDFHEWIGERSGGDMPHNPFLKAKSDELLEMWRG